MTTGYCISLQKIRPILIGRLHSIRIGRIRSESESRYFDSGHCCRTSSAFDRGNDCLPPIANDSCDQYDDNHDAAANYYYSNSYWHNNNYNPSDDDKHNIHDAYRHSYNYDSDNYNDIDDRSYVELYRVAVNFNNQHNNHVKFELINHYRSNSGTSESWDSRKLRDSIKVGDLNHRSHSRNWRPWSESNRQHCHHWIWVNAGLLGYICDILTSDRKNICGQLCASYSNRADRGRR